jgi:1,5-anhydro-D-fructose reductase (1,5-anhydro-D-mannitol-forming)
MKSITQALTWGIIGCGDVCEVKSGPAFNKVPNSSLVAVMRRDGKKAKDYADRHHVAKFYDDAADLIADKDINAIYIATPPASHEEYAIQAMRAGKPVYIEKPVSLNSESCKRMIDASDKYQVKASVAHYRRGLPLFKKVRSLVNEGAIGEVRLIKLNTLQAPSSKIITQTDDNWRVNPAISGGGLFHDLAPHQLDILYWIFGEPEKVIGQSLNQSNQYQAPDLTSVMAVYRKNILLNGVWAFSVSASAADETCQLIGDKGMMSFSFFRKSEIMLQTDAGVQKLEFDYPENIQQPMIDAVVKFFRGEGPNPCSLQEAHVIMEMMDQTR